MTDRDKLVLRIAKVLESNNVLTPTKVDITLMIVRYKRINKLWRNVYGIVSCHYQAHRVSNKLMYEICAILNPEWGDVLRERYGSSYKPKGKGGTSRKRIRKIESANRWADLLPKG
jgi:hypothetical protein